MQYVREPAKGRQTHRSRQHHDIVILQADSIVYNDALLLRWAQQDRYGSLREEVLHMVADYATGTPGGGGSVVRIRQVS